MILLLGYEITEEAVTEERVEGTGAWKTPDSDNAVEKTLPARE